MCAPAARGGAFEQPALLRSIINGMVRSTESRRLTHRICTGSRTKRAEKIGTARRHEHRAHDQQGLRRVGGQGVEDRLLQVVPGVAPLLHRRDDGGEVVVLEHHVRGFLGHLRAAPPMATPISAAFSAGASLTPSPVMATTCPLALAAPRRSPSCAPERRGRRPTRSTVSRSAASSSSDSSYARQCALGRCPAAGPRPAPSPGDRR
jgi:hypothetical protein